MSIKNNPSYKYGELKVAAEAVAHAILSFKNDMVLSEFEDEFLEMRVQSLLNLIDEQESR